MYWVYAEYASGPVSFLDADYIRCNDGHTEEDFARWAASIGYTAPSQRGAAGAARNVYRNPNDKSFIALIATIDDCTHQEVAGYIKIAAGLAAN